MPAVPLIPVKNLSDLTDASAARTNLGLGALATTTPGTGVATLLTGTASGSGGPAGTTSPVLVTPTLGVASATSVSVGNGSNASPSLAFTNGNGTGFYLNAGDLSLNVTQNGSQTARFSGAGTSSFLELGTNGGVRLGTIGGGDTGISRISAGIWGFGTGAQGSIAGGIQAATLALGGAPQGSNALAVTGSVDIAAGTLAASAPSINITQTWNNSGVNFTAAKINATNSAAGSGSLLLDLQVGGTSEVAFGMGGDVRIGGQIVLDSNKVQSLSTATWTLNSTNGLELYAPRLVAWHSGDIVGSPIDSANTRGGPNGVIYGGSSSLAIGSATTRTDIQKAVASIPDNTATTAFTVTIPNAAHSATIRVRLAGSSGAGGAIGANESTQEAEYLVNVTRTAGVNAVAAIGAVIGQPAAVTVAGGAAVAVSAGISAISGAVGATNTFTVQVTIARAGGSATNHTCLAFAELLNANASGVSIA